MEGAAHMSDTTTSGDRFVAAGSGEDAEEVLAVAVNAPDVVLPTGVAASAIIGRSPGQLAWLRLRRDRSVVPSAIVLGLFFVSAILAPLIAKLYGENPTDNHSELLTSRSLPLGVNGGMSGTHWFGVTPQLGRDIFMQLIYGLRTSLLIAFAAALLTTALGVWSASSPVTPPVPSPPRSTGSPTSSSRSPSLSSLWPPSPSSSTASTATTHARIRSSGSCC